MHLSECSNWLTEQQRTAQRDERKTQRGLDKEKLELERQEAKLVCKFSCLRHFACQDFQRMHVLVPRESYVIMD